jgi:hypothetical protein
MSMEPPPKILPSELDHWAFQAGDAWYPADTEHLYAWLYFVYQWAQIEGLADWHDMEARAEFLNRLYRWCERKGIAFPLAKMSI